MAKKELRIYFNLENENEKMLYEHLMKRTSASGYLKDIALDYLENKNTISTGVSVDIVEQLKNINNTLSNLSFVSSNQGVADEVLAINKKEDVISDIDMDSINVDNIDFSDISFD